MINVPGRDLIFTYFAMDLALAGSLGGLRKPVAGEGAPHRFVLFTKVDGVFEAGFLVVFHPNNRAIDKRLPRVYLVFKVVPFRTLGT